MLVATAAVRSGGAEVRLNFSAARRSWEMSRKFIWDPEHWRFRAEEARTVADQMTHEEARTIMRRIAMDYDRLAKLAEVQLIQEEIGGKTLPNNRNL
jgi:hypothetical protein